MRYRFVEAAVAAARLGEPCGPCPQQQQHEDSQQQQEQQQLRLETNTTAVTSTRTEDPDNTATVTPPAAAKTRASGLSVRSTQGEDPGEEDCPHTVTLPVDLTLDPPRTKATKICVRVGREDDADARPYVLTPSRRERNRTRRRKLRQQRRRQERTTPCNNSQDNQTNSSVRLYFRFSENDTRSACRQLMSRPLANVTDMRKVRE